jgi:hypothetical protein
VQVGSFTLSSSLLLFAKCGNTSTQLTITNTSSFDLTWSPSIAPSPYTFTFTPPGSTLAAGEAVTATIAVGDVAPGQSPLSQSVTVNASIGADGAPSQSLGLVVNITGRWHTPLPPDIDFGNVVIQTTSPQVFIPSEFSANSTETLGSSGDAFFLDNITARPVGPSPGWNLTFKPASEGPQETTLTFGTPFNGTDCPPNTFKARGVGVLP